MVDAPPDGAYSAEFEEPLLVDDEEHPFRLTRDGEPVTAERVCLHAEMVGMSGMAVTAEASQLGPGRYQVVADFPMEGPWQGSVLVEEQGAGEAAVPVSFEVRP